MTVICYTVLYTCASTLDVIVELVPEASSEYFVYSFRKFISRQGCSGKIMTDNRTVFTLQNTQNFPQTEILNGNSVQRGFWERLVSIVKS